MLGRSEYLIRECSGMHSSNRSLGKQYSKSSGRCKLAQTSHVMAHVAVGSWQLFSPHSSEELC